MPHSESFQTLEDLYKIKHQLHKVSSISHVSAPVFQSLKQNLMFGCCFISTKENTAPSPSPQVLQPYSGPDYCKYASCWFLSSTLSHRSLLHPINILLGFAALVFFLWGLGLPAPFPNPQLEG
jgi:hypothetical protein